MTSSRVRILLVASILLVSACRDEQPLPVDSVTAADSIQAVDGPVGPSTGWDESTAGPVMFLSVVENNAAAHVVFPMLTDSTLAEAPTSLDSLVDVPVELFSRRGLAGATSVAGQARAQVTDGCFSWPQARLADAATEPWRVGFIRGVVAPLPLDSIEAMTGSDSAAVTREVARLSSAAAEGDDPVFRGLPFIVRRAYRFTHGTSTVLAAEVVRKISEEANPREERILLIAERAISATGEFTVSFVSRTAGSEDAVRTNEIIGAFRFVRGDVPALVIAHDYFVGGRVALLQKDGARWRITWRSAYAGC